MPPAVSEVQQQFREQERELLKNFESVGRQVETDDGDVLDMADRLSEL